MDRRASGPGAPLLRLGLCCTFLDGPARFRHTTAAYVTRLDPGGEGWSGRPNAQAFIRALVLHNARARSDAVQWCAEQGVGAFRVQSQLVPLATHPDLAFPLEALGEEIDDALRGAAARARTLGVRLSLHPDQFVVLSSDRPDVVDASVAELEHQSAVAARIGADQVTLHVGSGKGGKAAAGDRLRRAVDRLSDVARGLLVLENDDRTWTVADLLPVVEALGLPLVYDVHHHRCNADELSVEDATDAAAATWGDREPWCHISSPLDGWEGPRPQRHADLIARGDLPDVWRGRRMTLDVEAKAKEVAVLALRQALADEGWPLWPGPAV